MDRCLSYAFAGAVLSLGAPLGLLAMQISRYRSLHRATTHLPGDPAVYAYVGVSTAIVFSAFGYLLGRQAERLADLSETDALTGLYNTRGLSHRLQTELARSMRYREPLALVLVDVDGLKRINDRHGHAAGDAAIRRVAEAIRSELRGADVAARWGGDEFAILAPNTPSAAALALAERVRALIAERRALWHVTGSVGIASVDGEADRDRVDEAVLMRTADRALYDAKRRGGDAVAIRQPGEAVGRPVQTNDRQPNREGRCGNCRTTTL